MARAARGTALARVRDRDRTRAGGSRRSPPRAGAHGNHLKVASQTCSRVERKFKHKEVEAEVRPSRHMPGTPVAGVGPRGLRPPAREPPPPAAPGRACQGLGARFSQTDQTPRAHAARRPQQAVLGGAQGLDSGRTSCPGRHAAARGTNRLRETGVPGRDADQGQLSPQTSCAVGRPPPGLTKHRGRRAPPGGRGQGAQAAGGPRQRISSLLPPGGTAEESHEGPHRTPGSGAFCRVPLSASTGLHLPAEGAGGMRQEQGRGRPCTLEWAAQDPPQSQRPHRCSAPRPRRPGHRPQQPPSQCRM